MKSRKVAALIPVALSASLLLPALGAAQTVGEISRQAMEHKLASTLKVWYNEDVEALRFRTIISVVGTEPPPPTAPEEASEAESPTAGEPVGGFAGLSMEGRQKQIAAIEQELAETEPTLRSLREKLSDAQTDEERAEISQKIDRLEASIEKARAEIEEINALPPPKPAKTSKKKAAKPAAQTPPPSSP
jgi:peptidoglycan hydrolase CwlO-like protein